MINNKLWDNFVEELEVVKNCFSNRDLNSYADNFVLREIDNYIVSSLERIFVLYEDTVLLIGKYRILSASITARSLFEAICMLIEFYRKIQASVQRRDLETFRSTITNFSFASQEFGNEVSVSLPNVMNAVRSSDKKFKNSLIIYGVLCEAVHPNWTGRATVDNVTQIQNDPVTLRLYISIMAISSHLNGCMLETNNLDEFLGKNKKNIEKMLSQTD